MFEDNDARLYLVFALVVVIEEFEISRDCNIKKSLLILYQRNRTSNTLLWSMNYKKQQIAKPSKQSKRS